MNFTSQGKQVYTTQVYSNLNLYLCAREALKVDALTTYYAGTGGFPKCKKVTQHFERNLLHTFSLETNFHKKT